MAGRKLPLVPGTYEREAMQIVVNAIDQRLAYTEGAAGKARYSITEPAGGRVRTYNPNTATLAETADVLATLLLDLKERGRIG